VLAVVGSIILLVGYRLIRGRGDYHHRTPLGTSI
jgi:hypothetical protein